MMLRSSTAFHPEVVQNCYRGLVALCEEGSVSPSTENHGSRCQRNLLLPSGLTRTVIRRTAQRVREKKTGRPAKFKLSDQTRQAIGNFLITAAKKPEEFLFAGRRGPGHCMITPQYARPCLNRSPASGSTQSCLARVRFEEPGQRSTASAICERHGSAGMHKIASTIRYLGIEVDDALAIAELVEV